jgi:hypothetical protein
LLNGTYFEVVNGSWVNNNKYGEQISNFHTPLPRESFPPAAAPRCRANPFAW